MTVGWATFRLAIAGSRVVAFSTVEGLSWSGSLFAMKGVAGAVAGGGVGGAGGTAGMTSTGAGAIGGAVHDPDRIVWGEASSCALSTRSGMPGVVGVTLPRLTSSESTWV